MRFAVKIKFAAFLAVFFTVFAISPATATYTPILTWERGLDQSVVLGGKTDSSLWTITLKGKGGETYTFDRSGKNSAGYFVYTIFLPTDFKLGRYEIYSSAIDHPESLVSYVDVVKLQQFLPARDTRRFGTIATVGFTLLSVLSASGLVIARREELDKDEHNPTAIDFKENTEENSRRGKFDEIGWGKLGFVRKLDIARFTRTRNLFHVSPLAARIVSDSSWFQALFGPLVLAWPIAGVFVGLAIANNTNMSTTLVPTSLVLVVTGMLLGIFDALAGTLVALTYFVYAIVSGNLVNIIDLRTLLGVSLLFIAPHLLAGTIRPIRRSADEWKLIDRTADVLVASVLAGFATKGIILALDGLSLQQNHLSKSAISISILVSIAVALRYLTEDVTLRLAPARLNYLVPSKKEEQETSFFILGLIVKIAIFLLFMYGFFGWCWQIGVALLSLIVPAVMKYNVNKFPNSPKLFQALPSGLPQMVLMFFIGIFVTDWAEQLPLVGEDRSKTILVFVAVPGLILSVIKFFGRSPLPGDNKWYSRENMKALHYVGGAFLVGVAFAQQIGVFG